MLFCEEKTKSFPSNYFFFGVDRKEGMCQAESEHRVEILLEKQCFDGFALPFLNSTTCLMGIKTKMEKTSQHVSRNVQKMYPLPFRPG